VTAIRQWRILERVELIETSVFTKQITSLLGDEEYKEFQSRLAANPQLGPLIKVVAGYARRAWLLDHEAKRRCTGHLLLGGPKRLDLAAQCVSEERGGGPDSETGSQLARVIKEEFGDEKADV